jgi:hypothetical protein
MAFPVSFDIRDFQAPSGDSIMCSFVFSRSILSSIRPSGHGYAKAFYSSAWRRMSISYFDERVCFSDGDISFVFLYFSFFSNHKMHFQRNNFRDMGLFFFVNCHGDKSLKCDAWYEFFFFNRSNKRPNGRE